MRIVDVIFPMLSEGFREVASNFYNGHDASKEEIDDVLSKFKEARDKGKIKGERKNIDFWINRDFGEFKEYVNGVLFLPSRKQIRSGVSGDQITIYEDESWKIIVPLDAESCATLGKGTDICISKIHQGMFYAYFFEDKKTFVFVINKLHGDLHVVVFKGNRPTEAWDGRNNFIHVGSLSDEIGINIGVLRKYIHDFDQQIESAREKNKYADIYQRVKKTIQRGVRDTNLEHEIQVKRNAVLASDYMNAFGVDIPIPTKVIMRELDDYELDYDNIPVSWQNNEQIKKAHGPK